MTPRVEVVETADGYTVACDECEVTGLLIPRSYPFDWRAEKARVNHEEWHAHRGNERVEPSAERLLEIEQMRRASARPPKRLNLRLTRIPGVLIHPDDKKKGTT